MADTTKKAKSNNPSILQEDEEKEKDILPLKDSAYQKPEDQDKEKKKESDKIVNPEESEKLLQTTRKIEKTPTNWLNGVGALCIGIGAFGVAIMPIGGVFFIALGIHLMTGNTKVTDNIKTSSSYKPDLPENAKHAEANSPEIPVSQDKTPLEAALERPGDIPLKPSDVKIAEIDDLLKKNGLADASFPSLEGIFKNVPPEEFLDFMIKKMADQTGLSTEKLTSITPKEFFDLVDPKSFSHLVLESFSEKANSPQVERSLESQIAALENGPELKNAEIFDKTGNPKFQERTATITDISSEPPLNMKTHTTLNPGPVVQQVSHNNNPELKISELGNFTQKPVKEEEEIKKPKNEEKNIGSHYILPETPSSRSTDTYSFPKYATSVEGPVAKEYHISEGSVAKKQDSSLNFDPEMPNFNDAAKSVAQAITQAVSKKLESEKDNNISVSKPQNSSINLAETPQKIKISGPSSARSATITGGDPEMPDFMNPAKAVAEALKKVTEIDKITGEAAEERGKKELPENPDNNRTISSKTIGSSQTNIPIKTSRRERDLE